VNLLPVLAIGAVIAAFLALWFVLGAVAYLLFATLSWIGMIVWRARASQGTHTPR